MSSKAFLAGSITCLGLLLPAPGEARCAGEKHGELVLEGGAGDEVNVGGGGWSFPLYGDCDGWQWRGYVRAALLRGREPPPALNTIWVASFIPSARRRVTQFAGADLYVEAGIGVSALSHTHINTERRMSTAFQFSELAGITLEVGGNSPFGLGLRVQHISNGGVKHPNDGITFVSLAFSKPF